MNLSKKVLKQIIREELEYLYSEADEESAAESPSQDFGKATLSSQEKRTRERDRTQKGTAGLDDKEKHVLDTIAAKLDTAARQGTLTASPTIMKYVKLLNSELDKVIK
jgi:hypothetical protein